MPSASGAKFVLVEGFENQFIAHRTTPKAWGIKIGLVALVRFQF